MSSGAVPTSSADEWRECRKRYGATVRESGGLRDACAIHTSGRDGDGGGGAATRRHC